MTATWIKSHISPFLFIPNLVYIFITSEYDSHIFWIDTVCFDTTCPIFIDFVGQIRPIHLKLPMSGQGRSRTFLFYFNCDKNFRVGPKYRGRFGKPETHIYFCLA